MKTNQIGMDLGGNSTMDESFVLFEKIITDRGSKYSVSGGRVTNREEVKAFLKELKRKKKYAKATHNTWAVRVEKDGQIGDIKNDDGETGAGATILRQLQQANMVNTIIVVTRWFGGVMLHGDRFKHVQDATIYFLENIEKRTT